MAVLKGPTDLQRSVSSLSEIKIAIIFTVMLWVCNEALNFLHQYLILKNVLIFCKVVLRNQFTFLGSLSVWSGIKVCPTLKALSLYWCSEFVETLSFYSSSEFAAALSFYSSSEFADDLSFIQALNLLMLRVSIQAQNLLMFWVSIQVLNLLL
jgi:hypothetical protein